MCYNTHMTQRLTEDNGGSLFTEAQLSYLADLIKNQPQNDQAATEQPAVTTEHKGGAVYHYINEPDQGEKDAKTKAKFNPNLNETFDSPIKDENKTSSQEKQETSNDRSEATTLPEIDTSKLFDLHKWFSHTSVVSLDKFPKRWEAFQERATQAGLTGYKKFHAIEGDKVPPSGWFRGGNGAWGCLMSHLRIVQDALMDDEPGHILVFEDDAVFSDDWLERMHKMMEEVGDDWDMLYLGGQHLHMPRVKPYRMPYNKEVINARNINRTHAFALNKKFLRKYQQHIMYAPDYIEAKGNFHIDHQLGILHQHQNYKILAAQPWINGQGAGLSWTCGRKTGENWWKINEEQILQQD